MSVHKHKKSVMDWITIVMALSMKTFSGFFMWMSTMMAIEIPMTLNWDVSFQQGTVKIVAIAMIQWPDTYPGSEERCNQIGDGSIDNDVEEDGFSDVSCGGLDCDDSGLWCQRLLRWSL